MVPLNSDDLFLGSSQDLIMNCVVVWLLLYNALYQQFKAWGRGCPAHPNQEEWQLLSTGSELKAK